MCHSFHLTCDPIKSAAKFSKSALPIPVLGIQHPGCRNSPPRGIALTHRIHAWYIYLHVPSLPIYTIQPFKVNKQTSVHGSNLKIFHPIPGGDPFLDPKQNLSRPFVDEKPPTDKVWLEDFGRLGQGEIQLQHYTGWLINKSCSSLLTTTYPLVN